jgi:hypothetical protein
LRGRGIEWPNFVESPNKWAENSQYNIGIGAFGRAQCEALKVQRKEEHPTLFLAQNNPYNLMAEILPMFDFFCEKNQ